MIPATARLTPEQREELDRAIGRLIVWLARTLHLPWWATVLLVVAIVAGALFAATRKPKRRAPSRPLVADRRPVLDFAFCGHCGHNVPPMRRAYLNGITLCHTSGGRGDAVNCFRLVHVGDHKSDGSCCTPGGR